VVHVVSAAHAVILLGRLRASSSICHDEAWSRERLERHHAWESDGCVCSEKVPLWLIEGMAQYFELARIEGDRLILGKEDRMRMALLRKWNKENGLVKLEDLIVSESASSSGNEKSARRPQ
jgi:hypothetical protein